MKKSLITLALLGAIAGSAFGQGMVFASAGSSTSTRISTNTVVGGAATGQTVVSSTALFYYALFASASQTSVNGVTTAFSGQSANTYAYAAAGWTLVGIGTNTLSVGRSTLASQGTTDANQTALNADLSASVSGIAGGSGARFVVVGWSANIGSTIAALSAWYNSPGVSGFIGQSAVNGSNLTLGDGGINATPNVFGTGANQIGGFTLGLVNVPEPGTLALAALGGASLLLFRRKK